MPENKKQWLPQELQLLEKLKQAYPTKQWKKISKQFAKKGHQRSQYECREKWVNYLDPTISHQPWTDNELVTLFREYDVHSSQWAIIQKSLPNRTQIKIKNQFYSLVRNLIRFVLKYYRLALGKQSRTSNRIHPLTLQKIYAGQQEFSFMQNKIKMFIREMRYRFDKIKFIKTIKENQQIFQKLNYQLLSYQRKREQEEGRAYSSHEQKQSQQQLHHIPQPVNLQINCQIQQNQNHGYLNNTLQYNTIYTVLPDQYQPNDIVYMNPLPDYPCYQFYQQIDCNQIQNCYTFANWNQMI